jgi:hypothetical protein
VKNNHFIVILVLALLVGFASESWAGLPQGTQTLVRFRRAYLISNITFPGGVGYYPQLEDDQAEAKETAVEAPALKPSKRVPVTGEQKVSKKDVKQPEATGPEMKAVEAYKSRSALRQRFSNGLFNLFNVIEFGDASIAKRMETSPTPLQFLDHYDNGEDYLYLPAIGIPVPIRLQSKNTFIH